jgi:regulatory protein
MRQRRDLPALPPGAEELHQAALTHLARFATTEAGLARVLQRRIDRWVRGAPMDTAEAERLGRAARGAIAGIVAAFVASGAVDDAGFAGTRARALTRAGKSRRAVGAWLAAKGVSAGVVAETVPSGEELGAALVHARKRRLGAWRVEEATPDRVRREFSNLARAGFSQDLARRALGMEREAAEAEIIRFRGE